MEQHRKPETGRWLLSSFARNQRGNVAVAFGLLLIPLMGTLALGTEVAGWLVEHRAEQNAADSAAIAAASEGGDGTGNYATVGKDVASQYGFTSGGTNGLTTTVTIATDSSLSVCTSSTPCYKATITRNVPISLAAVVGYKGPSGNQLQPISAVAIAVTKAIQGPFCITALGSAGITINGGGSTQSNLTCNVFSVGNMKCSGSHAQATLGVSDSEGSIKGTCGDVNQFENQSAPSNIDPFAADESSIAGAIAGATNECGSGTHTYYPVGNSSWPTGNKITSDPVWDGGTAVYCGDVEIAGNVTFSSSNPTTLIIENGNLDLTSGELQSGAGGLTVIFTGTGGNGASNTYTSGGQPTDFLTGGGNIDISAPSSGNFSGVAIFQDTKLPCCTSPSFGGSSPSLFEISGGIQAASANLSFNGDVGRASAGLSCFTLVVNSLLISGNAFELDFPEGAQAQCPQTQQVDAITGYTGQLVE